ncbi:MAG: PTS sugar transporter subunit IIA [Acidobacteriota bacterium]
MKLDALTRPELIFPALHAADRHAVLHILAESMVTQAPELGDVEALYSKLEEREALGSTGIGDGVAIPHCKLDGLAEVIMAIGVTREPIDFDAVDEQPVRLFFLVVSPPDSPAAHLRCLAAISRWVRSGDHAQRILASHDPVEIQHLLGGLES